MIETPNILLDPDFAESVILIKRLSTVNDYGEMTITETVYPIRAVVQAVKPETLTKLSPGAQLSQMINVYYRGQLTAETPGGYSDLIVWRGLRYQVTEVNPNHYNTPNGYTLATCTLEPVSLSEDRPWILATGRWNDNGIWIDSAHWEDTDQECRQRV